MSVATQIYEVIVDSPLYGIHREVRHRCASLDAAVALLPKRGAPCTRAWVEKDGIVLRSVSHAGYNGY